MMGGGLCQFQVGYCKDQGLCFHLVPIFGSGVDLSVGLIGIIWQLTEVWDSGRFGGNRGWILMDVHEISKDFF
jgi:hypothetical protein